MTETQFRIRNDDTDLLSELQDESRRKIGPQLSNQTEILLLKKRERIILERKGAENH